MKKIFKENADLLSLFIFYPLIVITLSLNNIEYILHTKYWVFNLISLTVTTVLGIIGVYHVYKNIRKNYNNEYFIVFQKFVERGYGINKTNGIFIRKILAKNEEEAIQKFIKDTKPVDFENDKIEQRFEIACYPFASIRNIL